MINNVVLVGRLGNDPELTYTQSGTAIAKFRLAVDRPPRRDSDQEETDWLNIVTFGRQAETCAQYLDTGALVGVEGRVQSRTWERQDGTRAYAVEINAFRVAFLESRQRAEERRQQVGAGAPAGQQGPPQGQPQAQQAPPPQQRQQQPQPSQPQPGPEGDWAMDEDEDPFGDQ